MDYVLVAVFFTALGVYASTVFPSVTGGDAGELLAEACLGGVPHPPGYPLFTMIMHIGMRAWPSSLFFGGPAQAANLICCCFGALAAVLLSQTIEAMNYGRNYPEATKAGAIIGASLFAFSPLTWEYSTGAEVFALNNFLLAACLYLTARVRLSRWKTERQWAFPCAVAFVSGLALSNQHASLLFVAPLALSVLYWSHRATAAEEAPPLKGLFLLSLSALAGLFPYVYLAYSAHRGPTPGSWGDQRTLRGLLRHVLREEYGTFKMLTFGSRKGARVSESALERVLMYWSDAYKQTGGLAPVLTVLSVVAVLFDAAFLVRAAAAALPQGRGADLGPPVTKTKRRAEKPKESAMPARISVPGKAVVVGAVKSQQGGPLSTHAEVWFAFACTFLFYLVVWHGVFSNLPLSSAMAFGVHQRFWMQPNLLLCVAAGDGAAAALRLFARAHFMHKRDDDGAHSNTHHKGRRQHTSSPPSPQSHSFSFVCVAVSTLVVAWRCGSGWREAVARVDRGSDGGHGRGGAGHGLALRRHGEALLNSLPPNALLVSHTDLDWNSVRYLRACEGARPDVVHVSAQLMPYPWFHRQAREASFYPGVVFPDANFSGVSTHKSDEGNGRLLENFVLANWRHFGGSDDEYGQEEEGVGVAVEESGGSGIFLDMQAVDETHIGSRGKWRKRFVLVPHGALYRVRLQPRGTQQQQQQQQGAAPPGIALCTLWQATALDALWAMRRTWLKGAQLADSSEATLDAGDRGLGLTDSKGLPAFDPAQGSWEFAALSVYHDAHYQLALFFLTYALDLQEGITVRDVPDLVRSLATATQLLDLVVSRALVPNQDGASPSMLDGSTSSSPPPALDTHTTKTAVLSSARRDVVKNCALAHVRLQAAIAVAAKNPALLEPPLQAQHERREVRWPALDYSVGQRLVEEEAGVGRSVTRAAANAVTRFLSDQPQDKDAPVFRAALAQYQIESSRANVLTGSGNVPGGVGDSVDGANRKKKRRKKKKRST